MVDAVSDEQSTIPARTGDSTGPERDLLAAVTALLARGRCHRGQPAPLAIAPGDRIGLVTGGHAARRPSTETLCETVARAGVTVLELDGARPFGAVEPVPRVKVLVVIDHSAILCAQRFALASGAPLLVPAVANRAANPLRLSLRPHPVVAIRSTDGRSGAAAKLLQLRGAIRCHWSFAGNHGENELFMRPTHRGILVQSAPGSTTGRLVPGLLRFDLRDQLDGSIDGASETFAPGSYHVSRTVLYRVHTELVNSHESP